MMAGQKEGIDDEYSENHRQSPLDSLKVRQVCVDNDLYTCGDCEEYSHMLDRVRELEPTYENICVISKDIMAHSKDQTVTNIMYLLENCAVTTTFEIDGDDNA